MNTRSSCLIGLILCSPLAALQSGQTLRPAKADAPTASAASIAREASGQHDFDFSIGKWTTQVSLLRQPLSGSDTWVDYEGTSVVREIWNGRANLVELDVKGPAGRIEGLNLRLYNPESRQWSLHYANSRTGSMTPPVTGVFRNGRGEFYGQETLDGRVIFVRFIVSNIEPDAWRYEQAFSADGGQTWEVNWIAVDTRVREE